MEEYGGGSEGGEGGDGEDASHSAVREVDSSASVSKQL